MQYFVMLVVCFPLVLLVEPMMHAFTRIGYRDWKHASGKQGLFEKHNNCHTHKQAMVAWYDYKKNTQKRTTIADRLDSARSLQVQHNRHYIKTVVEVILLCAQQDIGLRGIVSPSHP